MRIQDNFLVFGLSTKVGGITIYSNLKEKMMILFVFVFELTDFSVALKYQSKILQ